ncbi:MAG: glycosyltransferase family 2 protein [Alphaproteobacteria bacterium]|jgi:glycosyltransferase involved in cell wall biosynthesis|nr:glycosyltransferase family 2 protein [Alphaproteobacteria bacterium]HJO88219.1 glycosyltransferase family 2 protein [Alphaproteobacteria bacterium]
MSECRLSALVVAHNEEDQIADCLDRLAFADEIVVVLDDCSDGTKTIAARYTGRLVEGSWELEGDRRNAGFAACEGDWVLEVDADEQVTTELAVEIRQVISTSPADWHLIPVDNYVGERLVRYGWGASFGRSAFPGLTRKGVKRVGAQRVHPSLTLDGKEGAALKQRLQHFVDQDISDMLKRLDNYSTARALDLRDSGDLGSLGANMRRIFSRFWKCYVGRRGYREGELGFLVALLAGLFPILSYFKARYGDEFGDN